MKKIFTLVCFATFIFTSCSNDDDFIDTDTIGQTFEIDNVDFVSEDGTSAGINIRIPDNIPVFEADVALVYILDPELSATQRADVWEPLPRTFFFADGGFAQFRYNFIFDDPQNVFDIEVVLESDDFATLDATFTQDQVFRVVIVPSEFAQNTKIDLSDFNAVQSALNLQF